MRNMFKRVMALALAMLMILSMAACGGENEETKAPDKKTEASSDKTEAPEPSGDPVYINENAAELTGKVRFYTAFALEVGTGGLIEEFNKYYPNVEVECIVYKNNTDGNIQVDTAMQSGGVDVMLSFGVANTASRWAAGLWLDITDRLAADNLDLVKEWGSDTYKYNDRVYSFPSGALSFYIAINEDMWNAAGLGEVPSEWTWDEYLDACRKMTKDGVKGGVEYSDKESWTHRVKQVKGSNYMYNAEGKSDFDNPVFRDALNVELKAEQEGIWYSKSEMLANDLRNRQLFLGGNVATSVDCILTRYITSIDHDFKVIYAPYPVMEKGQTNYMAGGMPNSHIGIAKNCQDVEAAYAFAKFAATYGNKYMYASGHAGTWSGNKGDEILEVVFGSYDEAVKWVDPEGFNKYVVSAGQTSYSEDYIVGYTDIHKMVVEYTEYILAGSVSIDDMFKDLKTYGDEYIEDAQ